jgi:hypothetical protein
MRDPLCQVLPVDEFHHEGTNAAGLLETVNMRNIGVVKRSERLRFARESRQAIGVAGESVRQDLQRDIPIEFRVTGSVDLSHATFADQRRNFVDAETSAGNEGQWLPEYKGRTGTRTGLLSGDDVVAFNTAGPVSEILRDHSGVI